MSIPVSPHVQMQHYSSPATLTPERADNRMAEENLQERWGKIQHLFHSSLKAEAKHHLRNVLCPDIPPFDNPGYGQEVNAFNRASESFSPLAAMCKPEHKISRVLSVDRNTAQVTFGLGEYEVAQYKFDLRGGIDLSGMNLSDLDISCLSIPDLELLAEHFRGENFFEVDIPFEHERIAANFFAPSQKLLFRGHP